MLWKSSIGSCGFWKLLFLVELSKIGTYCKDYQQDECGRSVCHGSSHNDLNPCPNPTPVPTTANPTVNPITASPTDEPTQSTTSNQNDIYAKDGCAVFGADMDSFCYGFNKGYCKYWQADTCGRSVCKGHSHNELNPCWAVSALSPHLLVVRMKFG